MGGQLFILVYLFSAVIQQSQSNQHGGLSGETSTGHEQGYIAEDVASYVLHC